MINVNVGGNTAHSNVGSSRRVPVVSKEAALVWMTIVLLLAFALGAKGLNSEPIWADELYSLTNMGVFDPPYSLADIINSITTYSSDHVPFYYLLGAAWAQLAGWTQVSMRLFSILIGVFDGCLYVSIGFGSALPANRSGCCAFTDDIDLCHLVFPRYSYVYLAADAERLAQLAVLAARPSKPCHTG